MSQSEDTPVVSVVIPAHNAEGFISEALDSVLAQTLTDVEILVVDDGSTDRTREVVERYGPPVRYIAQEHGGASRARNRGIEEGIGEFVAFLDADDLWYPSKLERQVEAFRQDPSLGLLTTEHENVMGSVSLCAYQGKKEVHFGDTDVMAAIILHSNIATPTVMLPRWVLEEVGGFDESLRIGEDDNLWIRITAYHPAGLVDEVLVTCRRREESLSRDLGALFEDVLTSLDQLEAEHPPVRERASRELRLKRARVHRDMAYNHYAHGRLPEARAAARASIWREPLHRVSWSLLFASSLPTGLVRSLRSRVRRAD